MADFSIRRFYKETDFNPIFKAVCELSERTIRYYVTGCSCYPKPDQILKNIDKPGHSTVVAAVDDRPIGIAYHYY